MNRSPASRLLRGYGPLVVLVGLFVLMAAFVPTVGEKTQQAVATGPYAGPQQQSITEDTAAGATTDTVAGGGPAAGPTGGGGGGTGAALPAKTSACQGRDKQIPNDPYSPPCVAFSGDNGGATSKGVTKDTIHVAWRVTSDPGFQQALADAAKANIADSPEDVRRTAEALLEYFNSRFQLYGRKVKLDFYQGKGRQTDEILGKGQEEAEVDAQKVAEEIKAFADLTGNSPPYADALARRKVVNIGVPYLSREWLTQRRPYTWSPLTDCSIIVETASDYAIKKLYGKPAAFAGEGLQGKPRRFAALAPENTWYQECVDAGARILARSGKGYDVRIKYQLDLGTMSNQATNVIAKLKSEGVTTVFCGCDPVFPVFLTQQAKQQGYNPEWVVVGTALTDADLVGQLYDQDQWSHAFGISFAGQARPQKAGLGYAAYKAVRQDEPAVAVELIYVQMYLLFVGLQGAGPNLTPETFEQGMFAYPGGTGPFGTWKFGPQHYTPTVDAREIWWNPNAISTYNNQKGAYIESEPGKRYKIGEWPAGDPKVFGR